MKKYHVISKQCQKIRKFSDLTLEEQTDYYYKTDVLRKYLQYHPNISWHDINPTIPHIYAFTFDSWRQQGLDTHWDIRGIFKD